MKRLLSLLMAVVLLLTLSACGGSNEEGATDSSTTTTTTENSADNDGSATTSTTKKSTTTSKKTTTTSKKATTTTKKTTTTTATQNNSAVVCTGYKLIRVERADTVSKVDGEHILDYLLGKNEYFQQGDTLVYQFDFEKGNLSDCIVEKQINADVTIDDDLLKITFVKKERYSYSRIWLKDKSNNRFAVFDFFSNIFWYEGCLMDETFAMSDMFHIYAQKKHGIVYIPSKVGEDDYHYTKNINPISGNRASVSGDDLFYKADVGNWVKYIQWLLCEYEKIGIVSWDCQVRGKHVVICARTQDCCDNHPELA